MTSLIHPPTSFSAILSQWQHGRGFGVINPSNKLSPQAPVLKIMDLGTLPVLRHCRWDKLHVRYPSTCPQGHLCTSNLMLTCNANSLKGRAGTACPNLDLTPCIPNLTRGMSRSLCPSFPSSVKKSSRLWCCCPHRKRGQEVLQCL